MKGSSVLIMLSFGSLFDSSNQYLWCKRAMDGTTQLLPIVSISACRITPNATAAASESPHPTVSATWTANPGQWCIRMVSLLLNSSSFSILLLPYSIRVFFFLMPITVPSGPILITISDANWHFAKRWMQCNSAFAIRARVSSPLWLLLLCSLLLLIPVRISASSSVANTISTFCNRLLRWCLCALFERSFPNRGPPSNMEKHVLLLLSYKLVVDCMLRSRHERAISAISPPLISSKVNLELESFWKQINNSNNKKKIHYLSTTTTIQHHNGSGKCLISLHIYVCVLWVKRIPIYKNTSSC